MSVVTPTMSEREAGRVVEPAGAAPPVPALTEPERAMKGRLRLVAGAFFLLSLGGLAAIAVGPLRAFARTPPWGAAGVELLWLVGMLCLYASGDPRRRGGLAYIAAAALGVAALVTAALWVGPGAAASAVAMAVVLAVEVGVATPILLTVRAARASRRVGPARPAPSYWPAGTPDGAVRALLLALGLILAAAALLGLATPVLRPFAGLARQPILLALAVARSAALAAACFYVVADARDRLPVVSVVFATLLCGAAARLLLLIGTGGATVPLAGRALGVRGLMIGAAAVELLLAAVVFLVAHRDMVHRLRPRFLGTAEYRALMGLGAVLVEGPDEAVPAPEIAARVDRYLEKIRARRRWIQRGTLLALQLHPLLYVRPPLSELDEEQRLDHVRSNFQRDGGRRLLPERIRQFVQAMIRVAKQLTYVGYYSDPRSDRLIGYERFSARARYRALDERGLVPKNHEVRLRVTAPEEVDVTVVEADVCVVGSGAAGAVLAYHLAEQGKSVVVLERGPFVQPQAFSEDEVEMIGKLYADGAFQQTEDFRFTVLQGSCVGGTTVVNNAVCFATPEPVLERWNTRHLAGIDPTGYRASREHVERWLRIRPQDENTAWNPNNRLNPSARKYLDGVAKAESSGSLAVGAVDANIEGCLGCGYCNIGCSYGAKLSMLETALPWAQAAFGDRLRVFSECEVERVVMDGGTPRRAREVRARLSDFRPIRVRADRFVLSAGTIASSYILMRSGVGKGLPVGRHVSFNMGAPLTADFDEPLDAYDGLQISHFGVPRPERGWVFETWWNPPVSQALNMPGWFEDHYRNMRRYRHLMAVGVLVGTERNARIVRALTGGPGIDYAPTAGDRRKLADGLVELGHILFAAGARRVMLNAWSYYEFTSPNGLYELPRIVADPSELTLGTGHPQGGNAMSTDPALGVVGPDFRVHGCANLYVCDASVIPSSLTVNPQLTVMTLAHYAAPRILEGAA